jgi:predicted nucleotidyltransferase
MSERNSYPTPYPDVNAILDRLLARAQTILKERFVGMYLYGSLANGGFDPGSSDIDFLVVTDSELPDEIVMALVEMHAQIAILDTKWATELEGSYIPKDALRRHDPRRSQHPHIDRGSGLLSIMQHDSDWVVQRYVLRERGIVLAGPPLPSLIDPVSPDDLRQAIHTVMDMWWEPMLSNPAPLQHGGYRSYAILTMCRVLYTLQQGAIVPKSQAGQWAQAALEEQWRTLIGRAIEYRNGTPLITVDDALAFIRYAVEQSVQEDL